MEPLDWRRQPRPFAGWKYQVSDLSDLAVSDLGVKVTGKITSEADVSTVTFFCDASLFIFTPLSDESTALLILRAFNGAAIYA